MFRRLISYVRGSIEELTKVVWPTRREALKITGVVILFSLIVSVFLGLVDFGLTRLIALFAS